MTVSQKQAVFAAVTSATEVIAGQPTKLTRDQKTMVIAALVEGFKANEIQLKPESYDKFITNTSDDKLLIKYTGGLLNNWLRKDTRLNGGDTYKTKNPGSRNPKVSNMRKLQAQFDEGSYEHGAIEEKIQAELAKTKAKASKAKPIDYSAIDPELLESLGLGDKVN